MEFKPEALSYSVPAGAFGIVSSIVDASSQRTSSGRPAALPDGYGLGTRTGGTGSSFDTGAGGALRVYVN